MSFSATCISKPRVYLLGIWIHFPGAEQLQVSNVTQLEKDTILVCFDGRCRGQGENFVLWLIITCFHRACSVVWMFHRSCCLYIEVLVPVLGYMEIMQTPFCVIWKSCRLLGYVEILQTLFWVIWRFCTPCSRLYGDSTNPILGYMEILQILFCIIWRFYRLCSGLYGCFTDPVP